MAKQKRRIYCKFCDYFCYTPEDFVSHLEKHHDEMIPEDMTPWQFSYYLRTGKTHGSCICCKKDTTWNEKTHKYNRFCNNPKCKEKYRELFKNRMIGKYGRTHLLNDPEQQKKMLANRKISGEYTWRDHITKTTYTGSYERNFLVFLDEIMNFDPSDIMDPSPHTYYYDYEGEKHFYIPDFFIPSLNLEIEIKDGGNNVNQHPKIQAVDKVKEKLKDEVMMKNQFHYVKITNQNHRKFFEFLNKAKEQFYDKKEEPIYMTEKALTLDDLNKLYTENINEIKNDADYTIESIVSSVDDNYKSKGKKMLSSFKHVKLSKENINMYKKDFKALKHIKENCEGYLYIDNDKCIAVIAIEDKGDYKSIQAIEIDKSYQGYGLSKQLLDIAVNKFNASHLSVNKKNKLAINIYKKYGFIQYDETNTMIFMNINKSYATESDSIFEEACKSPKEVRELSQKVKELAKEYNANFYFVTDGASVTSNNGNPAVKVARDAVAEWERKNGFDDKEDWSDNPDDFSNYHLKKESYMEESTDKSKLDKNFKKKTGKNFKFIDIGSNKSQVEKYLVKDKTYNQTYKKHMDKISGEIAIDEETGELAGYVFIINKFITPLSVLKKYRGYGLGDTLTKDAIKKYDAKRLWVFKDNQVAIRLYEKNGFKTYIEDEYPSILMATEKKYADEIKTQLEHQQEVKESYFEDLYTESLFLPEKDFKINLDKWKPGTPLWITGTSGDGKSTLARKLAEEKDGLMIPLDLLLLRLCYTEEKWKSKINDVNSQFYIGNKRSEMIFDYVNKHKDLPFGLRDTKTNWADPEILKPYYIKFFDWIYENASTNPKYKNRYIIVEGCDVCHIDPSFICKQPLIILGNSVIISMIRRTKREANGSNLKGFINELFKQIKKYNVHVRYLDNHKDKFRNDVIDALSEIKTE